jgi:hypothetical protein
MADNWSSSPEEKGRFVLKYSLGVLAFVILFALIPPYLIGNGYEDLAFNLTSVVLPYVSFSSCFYLLFLSREGVRVKQ